MATSSLPGPTDPGLIALLAEIQTSNQAMIPCLDALKRRTAQQGPQEAVNAAVDQVLQSLTGTLAPNPTVPVDIHVPDKIRQKILQDEFVDFAILLQRQKGDVVYTLAVDSQSGQPNLVFIFIMCSCKIFETFSTAIQWMAHHKQGVQHMTHILDDFFMVSQPVSKKRLVKISGYVL